MYHSVWILMVVIVASSDCWAQHNSGVSVNKRLEWREFRPQGAFRLPMDRDQVSRFGYSSGAVCFRPAGDEGRGSLFVGGHAQQQLIAEVSIPEPRDIGCDAARTRELPMAAILQPFGDPTGGYRKREGDAAGIAFSVAGLAVLDCANREYLAWTICHMYPVARSDYLSHGMAKCSLVNPEAKGVWRVGGANHHVTAGYMCPVTPATARRLGLRDYNLLTGQQGVAGQGKGSWGPALFAIRMPESSPPDEDTLDSVPPVWHPREHAFPGWGMANKVWAAALLEADNRYCVAFLVRVGKGEAWYGPGASYPYLKGGDVWDLSKGFHAPPYVIQLWLYDVDDLLQVAKGTADPWMPRPFEQVDVTSCLVSGNPVRALGMTYDSVGKRLYILWADVDKSQSGYEATPVVNVFGVN